MQTKIKYNMNWYKPEEEITQWEKVKNKKVIKVKLKGIEERNKFGDPRDWTQALTKGWDFLRRGMTIGANAQIVI